MNKRIGSQPSTLNSLSQQFAGRFLIILAAIGAGMALILFFVGRAGAMQTQKAAQTTPTPTTVRISEAFSMGDANGESKEPTISANGRFVAYVSNATDIIITPTSPHDHIYRIDHDTNEVIQVSIGYFGAQPDNGSFNPDISSDGNFVAFETDATNLQSVAQSFTHTDIYLYDHYFYGMNGESILISAGEDSLEANGPSFSPSVSGDGRFCGFCFGCQQPCAWGH